MYNVGGVPHAEFDGYTASVGGGIDMYPTYSNIFNNHINYDSPLEMEIEFGLNDSGVMAITADVTVVGEIPTTNNNIVFLITRRINNDYFCSVVKYELQDFDLSEINDTNTYEQEITLEDGWDIANLKAIVLVQTWSNYPAANQHKIIQARQTEYSGILPLFTANITEGPASLDVTFTENSFPLNGIDLFEWDLDNDGVFETTGSEITHSFNEVGTYDISLRITVGDEVQTTTATDFITVTDGSNIQGNLAGTWMPEHNPYIITADAQIENVNELIIQPGTEISFENDAKVTVYGKVSAAGTSEAPIHFTSETGWKGFKLFDSTFENVFSFCSFSGAITSPLDIQSSSVDINECRFSNNNTGTTAGAINVNSSDNVTIYKNLISNNVSDSNAGAISVTLSDIEIKNNIIVNNQGCTAGAFDFRNVPSILVENNTIVNNIATSPASGLFFVFNAFPVIQNNILLDDGLLLKEITPNSSTVSYSCLSEEIAGTGNIVADPLFVSPTLGSGSEFSAFTADWTLQEDSPCIDAGSPNSIFNDIEDPDNLGYALWPAMGTITNDMGAFGGSNSAIWVDNDDDATIPSMEKISVYPNPFNPNCKISFNIEKQSDVKIGIYNVKGQLVKNIERSEMAVGQHSIVWNGKDNANISVSSGVYYFKVEMNKSTGFTKALLLK